MKLNNICSKLAWNILSKPGTYVQFMGDDKQHSPLKNNALYEVIESCAKEILTIKVNDMLRMGLSALEFRKPTYSCLRLSDGLITSNDGPIVYYSNKG